MRWRRSCGSRCRAPLERRPTAASSRCCGRRPSCMRPTRPAAERAGRAGRFLFPLSLALFIAATLFPLAATGPRAVAQTVTPAPATPVALRLISQSPWNGPSRPLRLSFAATNEGTTPLSSLVVALTIEAPARSRSVYDLSLTEDATAIILGTPFVETGRLDPGAT